MFLNVEKLTMPYFCENYYVPVF